MLLSRTVSLAGASSTPMGTGPAACSCGGTCPACTGLDSFCRPRFFAGQLLTDRDLNSLESYLVNKNKLHNRYLVGWGVACGLQVLCSPCKGMVTVKPGYAISPCGEDIIVPCEASVDICSLISKCITPTNPSNCPPMRQYMPAQCNDVPTKWLLTIRYVETAARGITPLSNSKSCQCGSSKSTGCGCSGTTAKTSGCGCGSSGSSAKTQTCGCGCGGSTSTGTTAQPGTATNGSTIISNSSCQPTQICEGYVFELCPMPALPTGDKKCPTTRGPIARACNCLQSLLAGFQQFPGVDSTQSAQYTWLCNAQNYAYNLLISIDLHDCTALQKLSAMVIPQPGDPNFDALYANALTILATILVDQLYNCICLAMLPPCPDPVCDDRVILATVTVSGSGSSCQVVDICNFSDRNFLVTMQSLAYWLGDITPLIRKAISSLCCRPIKREVQIGNQDPATGQDKVAAQAEKVPIALAMESNVNTNTGKDAVLSTSDYSTADPGHVKSFTTAMAQAFIDPSRNISPEILVAQALGLPNDSNAQASDAQLADPVHYILADLVFGPAAQSVFPDMSQFRTNANAGVTQAATRTEAARDLELTQVQAQVAELKSTVQRQEDMIGQLLTLVKAQN